MKDLIIVSHEQAVVDSRQVGKHFSKEHKNVLQTIDNLMAENSAVKKMFYRTTYTARGKEYPCYLMNRDGFSLLVMGFTGNKAMEWKLKYIDCFNRMERQIMSVQAERQTAAWVEARKTGIIARKAETDVIRQLVEYAKGQDSKHADMLYMTYSRLANSMAGIKKRELANTVQLNLLMQIENIILKVVRMGMEAGKHYKEIYKDCKERLTAWLEMGMIDVGALAAIGRGA